MKVYVDPDIGLCDDCGSDRGPRARRQRVVRMVDDEPDERSIVTVWLCPTCRTADDVKRKVQSFIEEMREQGIHVGLGAPPRCVTCGDDWPCAASQPDNVCGICGLRRPEPGMTACRTCAGPGLNESRAALHGQPWESSDG